MPEKATDPPITKTSPTRMASIAARSTYSSLPAAAIGVNTVAPKFATVDSGPTFSSRLLPQIH